jgi:ligand-binding sensor domain-containing protein
MLRLLYKIFFLFASLTAISQSFTYRSYNVNQGLPSSQVYDIIQDQKKYIWVATDRGVSRFDGYSFTNFTSENGLLDNNIYNIFEDLFGRIWFLSYCGKLSYYYNNKIYPYKYNSSIIPDPKKPLSPIRSFYVFPDSSILIGTMGAGVLKISDKGEVRDESIRSAKYGYSYFLQNTGDHYYSYYTYSQNFRSSGISIYRDARLLFTRPIQKGQIKNAFFIHRKNQHTIFTSAGTLIDIHNDQVVDTNSSQNAIISLFEDSDSCLWVGYVDGGIKKFPPNKSFNYPEFKIYFQQSQVTKVLEDYEHGLWFTTLYNGVIYVPNNHIENLDLNEETNAKEKTVSLTHDFHSTIFIGTNKGVVKFFKNGKAEASKELKTKGFVKTLLYDSVSKLLYISNNNIGYSYSDQGLKEIISNSALSLLRDKQGAVMAGSYSGIIKNFPDETKPNIICANEVVRVEKMCFDENNKLWIGSFGGLYYVKDSKIYKQNGDSLLNYRVTSLLSKNKTLIIGTVEKGILQWNGSKTEIFSTKSGLPSNIINSLALQNDSVLWAATSKGICKINWKQKKVQFTLDVSKGLCSDEVKDVKILNDTIYALTNEGVSFFNSGKVFKNTTAPLVYIQDFKVDTISYIFQNNPMLNHSRNYLTFNVTGLTFKQAGNVRYTYRLKGYSEKWRTTASNNIQLAFVPPGSYTFEVLAENEDHVQSLAPATFAFTISEPLWDKAWFQLLIALFLLSILVLVLLVRISRIKEKNKILEQLTGFKQQALTMQMNPHFIFNLLSSIQSYVLSEDSVKASKYIAMFAKLMRKSLDNSRTEFIVFKQEIETLKLYIELESIRIKNKIVFSFVYDSTLMHDIMIPPMLIQPHIENALKHAFTNFIGDKEREIRVSFTLNNKLLTCSVEDNGIGLNKARELKQESNDHVSTGLEVTKTRLELLCKNLGFPYSFTIQDSRDLDTDNNGTIVKFTIPYIYDNESSDS